MRRGCVYPSQWIRKAIQAGIICSDTPIASKQIQPNSLDIRVSSRCHRVHSSFLPGQEGVRSKLSKYSWYSFHIPDSGAVLERNQVYFFELEECLRLPPGVYAKVNPKSTTGRLDIFTRLVTECATSFDESPEGYNGKLYLEVVPRSFAIKVRPGDSFGQIRFQSGDPRLSVSETAELLDNDTIVMDERAQPLRSNQLLTRDGLVLGIDLPKRGETVGYVARRNTAPIDLRAVGGAKVRHYWDRLFGENRPVILEPDEFYIFRSKELVRLPAQVCAEMVAFEASSGELRTHYAGFFDSGFGYIENAPPALTAAAVVLEVRSRDVPFLVEDGQPLFRINVMWSEEEPDLLYGQEVGSSYQSQRLKLPKQFSAVDVPDGPHQAALDF